MGSGQALSYLVNAHHSPFRLRGSGGASKVTETTTTPTSTVRRPRPAAVILTAAAEARVAKLMGEAPEGAIGVKLSTPRRGCSGLAYSVDYVTAADPLDERIETPGGLFFIDSASVLYLIGSTMDWVEDDFSAGFVFQNPNAKGTCGCGESFTV